MAVSCAHFTPDAPGRCIGTCAVNRFPNGKAHCGYCATGPCPLRQEVAEAEAQPSALTLAGRALKAGAKWIAAGAPVASEEVQAERQAICNACEFWDPTGWKGLGKCKHPRCGCTGKKLKLATEACPVGKWLPVTDSPNPAP